MAAAFVARNVSLSITAILLTLIGFSFIHGGTVIQSRSIEVQRLLANFSKAFPSGNLHDLLNGTESVLFIKDDNEIVYSTVSPLHFQKNYFNDDYFVRRINSLEVYFSYKDVKRVEAFVNMLVFTIIAGIAIAAATLYRRFFNRHISEVVGVMLRGYRTADYSTPVRIDERRTHFETYQLAEQYNRKWLPLKSKILEIKRKR